MNKKKIFFLVILIFIGSLFYNLLHLINLGKKFIDDTQLTTLTQKVNYPTDQNTNRLLAGEKRLFEFRSNESNLGIIAFLFNNHEVKTNDTINFKLIEENSGNIVYEEEYPTDKISKEYFYTFGFPAIKDSKDKDYLVEIQSLSGKSDNSISIHQRIEYFLIKYSYPKSYLIENKAEIIPFIFKKLYSNTNFISRKILIDLIIKSFILTLKLTTILLVLKVLFYNLIITFINKMIKRRNEITEYLSNYKKSDSFKIETFLIFSLITLFLNSAFLSPIAKNFDGSLFMVLLLAATNIIYLRSFLNIIKLIKINVVINNWFILIPATLFAAIRIAFLDTVPKWDSAVYYHGLLKSISTFNFSFESFMAFNWHKHPSMGFGLFSALFQFPSPDNLIMLSIGNLVLGILVVTGFYYLIDYFFKKNSKFEKILATSLFAVNPLFIAVSSSFVPDYGVISFFVLGLAAFFHKKHFLSVFFFLFAIFSKETGGYTYTLFALFYSLIVVVSNISRIKVNKIAGMFFYVVPGIVYFFYLLYTKGSHWTAGKPIAIAAKDCFFCFAFRPTHFIQNIWVMFILNFNWVFTLFILLFLFKLIFMKWSDLKKLLTTSNKEMFSILLTFFGFVFFFMIFVIYIVPSYMLISVFFLTLVGYFSLNQILKSKQRIIFLPILITILIVQNFVSIDLFSAKIFGTFEFGKFSIPKVGTEYAADGMIYNTQFIYIDRLLNKFHKKINITNEDNIIINADYWDSFYLGGGGYELYINDYTKEINFTKSGSFRPGIFHLKASKNLPDYAYYISFPWIENVSETEKILNTIYSIEKKDKVEINTYYLDVYHLVKKQK
jgi:hypothetical protein